MSYLIISSTKKTSHMLRNILGEWHTRNTKMIFSRMDAMDPSFLVLLLELGRMWLYLKFNTYCYLHNKNNHDSLNRIYVASRADALHWGGCNASQRCLEFVWICSRVETRSTWGNKIANHIWLRLRFEGLELRSIERLKSHMVEVEISFERSKSRLVVGHEWFDLEGKCLCSACGLSILLVGYSSLVCF